MAEEEYEEFANGLVTRGGFGAVRPVKRKSDGKVCLVRDLILGWAFAHINRYWLASTSPLIEADTGRSSISRNA